MALIIAINNTAITISEIPPDAPVQSRPMREIAALFRKAAGKNTGHAPDDIEALSRNPTYSKGAAFLGRAPDGTLVAAGIVRISRHFSLLHNTPLRNKRVGYLAVSAVDPAWQGSGLYQSINRKRVNWAVVDNQVKYLCVRTQNPKLFASTQSALAELVRSGAIKSFSLIRKDLAPGIYGQQLTAQRHYVDDPEIMQHFNDLNYEIGDSRVFVWQIDR